MGCIFLFLGGVLEEKVGLMESIVHNLTIGRISLKTKVTENV